MPQLTDNSKATKVSRTILSVIHLGDDGSDRKIKPFPVKPVRAREEDKAQFNTERIFKPREHEYL